jgi:hypothetical protein
MAKLLIIDNDNFRYINTMQVVVSEVWFCMPVLNFHLSARYDTCVKLHDDPNFHFKSAGKMSVFVIYQWRKVFSVSLFEMKHCCS